MIKEFTGVNAKAFSHNPDRPFSVEISACNSQTCLPISWISIARLSASLEELLKWTITSAPDLATDKAMERPRRLAAPVIRIA